MSAFATPLNHLTRSTSLTSMQVTPAAISLAETLNVSSYFPSPPSQPLILGHRGSPFLSFENTLPSYLSASLHADGVELDVFPLTDDTLVCYHGKGSDQECGIMNESHGLDLSIKTLDYEGLPRSVKKSFGDKACEIFEDEEVLIPKLEEVLLEFAPSNFHLTIELKASSTEALLTSLLSKTSYPLPYITVSSFHHAYLSNIKSLNQDVRVACLFNSPLDSDWIEKTKEIGAEEVHLRYDTCTMENVRKAKEAGLSVMSWCSGPLRMSSEKWSDCGNEDEDFYDVILRTGVDKICVNRPDVARKVCDKIWGEKGEKKWESLGEKLSV
ncbi:hypothetical protein TrVE_jg5044 [Triparma verrucosa]|uniref:GP-PDE domain-containing protein n=1 Tax=Triparma verrucosa TaxID=1606542 RepID=A0A9W7BIJ4_9STRA|nr:hypothetical protein TrVE_jg5044 [Triparma verrucosa]